MIDLHRRATLWLKRRQINRLSERVNWIAQHVADYESHAAYGRTLIDACHEQQRRLQSECWSLESPSDILRRSA